MTDLTDIDLKAYGITGELPRLIKIVEKRRDRAREAWTARDAAREAVARTDRDLADAIQEAVAADKAEPDLESFRRDREDAHSLAKARVTGTNAAVADAERDVARCCLEDPDAADVLDAVRAEFEDRLARAVELAVELTTTVLDAAEAAALLEAIRDVDVHRGMPKLPAPKSYAAVKATTGLAETVAALKPKPPAVRDDGRYQAKFA